MGGAVSRSEWTRAIWREWTSLDDDDPSPVGRVALRLGLEPAEVARVVRPHSTTRLLGMWQPGQEPPVEFDAVTAQRVKDRHDQNAQHSAVIGVRVQRIVEETGFAAADVATLFPEYQPRPRVPSLASILGS